MVSKSIKYNPAFLSESELINSFVVRKKDLDIIIETIEENDTESNQHILVVGPRGMGKTMLALRVAAEVRNNPELFAKWYPVVFGEESYEVTSAGEIWLACLFHLGQITGYKYLDEAYNKLLNEKVEKNLYDRALSTLMDFADKENKRLLVIVENINMLLGEQISNDDGWTLRHTLINEPRIMLLSTSTTRFDEIENMGKALFEMFRIQPLEPLTLSECRELWKAITGEYIKDDRMRPIQILTGGNPRLLSIIASFAAGDTFQELMSNLTHLIDEQTNYFKSNIENLPPLERKIFVTLASIWEPSTAHEVSERARTTVSKTSALLNRLVSRGTVAVVTEVGRKKYYQLVERLYNIYYLMRRTGIPTNRVKAVVDFMIHYYEGSELASRMTSLSLEACCQGHNMPKDHVTTYQEVLKHIGEEEDVYFIVNSTIDEFFETHDFDSEIKEIRKLLKNKLTTPTGKRLNTKSEYKAVATQVAESIRDKIREYPENKELWAQLGWLYHERLQQYKKSEEAYRKAIDLDNDYHWAWAHLGWLFHDKLERFQEAEEAYKKAIKLDNTCHWCWAHLGSLYVKLDQYHEAEKAFRQCIKLRHDHKGAWLNLGLLLQQKLKQSVEAEEAFRKVIEIDNESHEAWANLGWVLEQDELKRYEEAEEAYRKAVIIEPNYSEAWAQLGSLLYSKLNRYEEAEEALRKSIKINNKNDIVWQKLGWLLSSKLNRYKEAEKAYNKAIKLDPNNDIAWAQFGVLLSRYSERYQEAEEALRKAIEIDPDYHWAWEMLARLLDEKLQRYDEAEQAYRKAIESEPNCDTVWAHLGLLLINHSERYQEAEEALRKAIEIDPDYHWAWNNLAWLLGEKLQRYDEAEQAYRKAIELDPDSETSWVELGRLLNEKLDRIEEAEEAIRKAICINRDSNLAWAQLGSILSEDSKRYREAEEAYKRSISIDPDFHWVWEMLARHLDENLKRYDEAEQAYNKAIELEPDCYTVWAYIGMMFGKLGRYEEAERALRKSLSIHHEWSGLLKYIIRYQFKQSIAFDQITNTINDYFDYEGKTSVSLNDMAWEVFKAGSEDELLYAEKMAKAAVKLDPESPYCAHTLASILAKRGKWKEAFNMARTFSNDAEIGKSFPSDIIDFFKNAATAGHAKEGLEIIQKSQCAQYFEPLIIALKMIIGIEYNAPQEVIEIARDIVKSITNQKSIQ